MHLVTTDLTAAARPGPPPAGPPLLPAPPGPEALWAHPLVARLAAAGQRLRRLDQDRPWLLDTAVVLVVLVLSCLPDLVHRGGPRGLRAGLTQLPVAGILAFQAALVLPLWWRRRAPSLAYGVIAAVFVVQWSLLVVLRADVALLIALYGLALHGRLRHLPYACAVMAGALGLVAVQVSSLVTVGDALFFLASAATASVALGLALRIRRAHVAALRERAVRLEIERDQRTALAAAAERARVAREMHDIIGHNLSVIIGLADGGAYAADVNPGRGKEALQLIAGTGREALGEMRRMLGVLREDDEGSGLRPQPGLADLADLCERVRAAGPQVTYRTGGDLESLDLGAQLVVYRIAQEALTNSLKHAGSGTTARLRITVDGPAVAVRVEDTGPPGGGPDVPAPADTQGQGLAGMRERAALYAGSVTAGPRPGGGWTVEALLTLSPPAAAPGPPPPTPLPGTPTPPADPEGLSS
ncbi:sensor histidine kinase [Kitasatospora sp. NPDC057015]|uniref:sensor histidine kinase n=1 Tax=Kitasatospora sp. NPDC057015 TaxID=3346001 RepID=UPI00363E2D0C